MSRSSTALIMEHLRTMTRALDAACNEVRGDTEYLGPELERLQCEVDILLVKIEKEVLLLRAKEALT